MRKTYLIFIPVIAFILYAGCTYDYDLTLDNQLQDSLNHYSKTGHYSAYIMPSSHDYAALPNQDPKNPVTEAKVRLGQMLFFETALGLEAKKSVSLQAYSCSTCHIPSRSFTAGRFQGIADGAIGFGLSGEGRKINPLYTGDQVDAQGARPLTIINTAYVTNALWAGSFGSFNVNIGTEDVWNQDTLIEINFKGLMGLEANNARALAVHRQVINKAIVDSLGYTAMFDEAFPDIPIDERYNRITGSYAIAAYFRTVLANEAPFQMWLKGDREAMNDQQKRGAILFFGKAGCVHCHNSPSLNSEPHKFFALGVRNEFQNNNLVFRTDRHDKRNLGRGGFTGRDEDMHKFKVPQLYNLKDFGFYFHGASKTTIKAVVEYFNEATPENPDVPITQISNFFQPLHLTKDEIADLVEFLENGLFDPNMTRYTPDFVLSGNCFPNNDSIARIDLGCH
ncbi:MAG TPA: cytochrome c peroxidase [Saprospiraceae bacterium]|nr:cytochrome c peroxidase [Saprospiraceae bacterium]